MLLQFSETVQAPAFFSFFHVTPSPAFHLVLCCTGPSAEALVDQPISQHQVITGPFTLLLYFLHPPPFPDAMLILGLAHSLECQLHRARTLYPQLSMQALKTWLMNK